MVDAELPLGLVTTTVMCPGSLAIGVSTVIEVSVRLVMEAFNPPIVTVVPAINPDPVNTKVSPPPPLIHGFMAPPSHMAFTDISIAVQTPVNVISPYGAMGT